MTVRDMYDILQTLYNYQEDSIDAFNILVTGNQKKTSYIEYVSDTRRLLKLIQGTHEEKIRVLIQSLRFVIPNRIMEKIIDLTKSFSLKMITTDFIFQCLKKYIGEIEKALSKQTKSNHVKVNKTRSTGTDKYCEICKKTNHDTRSCFRNKTCPLCKEKGHTPRYCFKSCKNCSSILHRSVKCPEFGQNPAKKNCPHCKQHKNMILYHKKALCPFKTTENV